MIEKDKDIGINKIIKDLNKSFFNYDFFVENFNFKTQQDINNYITENNIETPELKAYLFDYFIEYIHESIDFKIKKDDFLLINDSVISKVIKEYFVILMFNDINDKITDIFYENIKQDKSDEDNNYYFEFKKAKENIPYFDKFKKMYNSDKLALNVINLINNNISEKNYDILTSAIKSCYDKLKNEN